MTKSAITTEKKSFTGKRFDRHTNKEQAPQQSSSGIVYDHLPDARRFGRRDASYPDRTAQFGNLWTTPPPQRCSNHINGRNDSEQKLQANTRYRNSQIKYLSGGTNLEVILGHRL